MAEKRMFSKRIVDSDAFLDMPQSSQCLYFHLNMRADDDGFINNPRRICRMIGASDDDLKILIGKRFVLAFDSGVIVIKHWRINNYLRSDRYKGTAHIEEKQELSIKENGSYTLSGKSGIPVVDQWCTQYSIDKDSIDKSSKGKSNTSIEGYPVNQTTHDKLVHDYSLPTIIKYYEAIADYVASKGKKDYADYSATARQWIKRDQEQGKAPRKIKPVEVDEIEEAIKRGEIR